MNSIDCISNYPDKGFLLISLAVADSELKIVWPSVICKLL
jgi:hypothetical protein